MALEDYETWAEALELEPEAVIAAAQGQFGPENQLGALQAMGVEVVQEEETDEEPEDPQVEQERAQAEWDQRFLHEALRLHHHLDRPLLQRELEDMRKEAELRDELPDFVATYGDKYDDRKMTGEAKRQFLADHYRESEANELFREAALTENEKPGTDNDLAEAARELAESRLGAEAEGDSNE